MSNLLTVGRDRVITMQYSLTNTNGDVLRDAASRPVSYLHGAGTIPPRLEAELETHRIGDIVRACLLPDDAFGKRDVDLVLEVPLSEIPGSDKIEVGGHVVGTDEDGNDVRFEVKNIDAGVASLDGNHPLAGQTLIFEVEIQGIREATPDELSTGKVAGDAPDV